ncbi:hypothetical protein GCM10020367_59560 [Streptomyces sannanensis]|uniref:Uncharacterized protein n=1 Tax=Streptomyces sannanensis TaxID=285536 RepID=A0ABP6SJW1_9ACTN
MEAFGHSDDRGAVPGVRGAGAADDPQYGSDALAVFPLHVRRSADLTQKALELRGMTPEATLEEELTVLLRVDADISRVLEHDAVSLHSAEVCQSCGATSNVALSAIGWGT